MEKFQCKYRIPSNRMPKWDYAGNGIYFITLVTRNRVCNLGGIKYSPDSKIYSNQQPAYMELSDFGEIIESEWLKSFEIRKELLLDEYIIMPNHLHAIVVINKPENHVLNQFNDSDQTPELQPTIDSNLTRESNKLNDINETQELHVETHGRASLRADSRFGVDCLNGSNPRIDVDYKIEMNPISESKSYRKPKSISSFIAGFKSVVNSKIDDHIDALHLDIPKYNRKNPFFQPNYYDHIIRNDDEYLKMKIYIQNNPNKWLNDRFNPLNTTELIKSN